MRERWVRSRDATNKIESGLNEKEVSADVENNNESMSGDWQDSDVEVRASGNELKCEASGDTQSENKRRKGTLKRKGKQLNNDDSWVTDDGVVGSLLELKKEEAKRYFEVLSKLEVKVEKAYGDLVEALASMSDKE